MPRTVIPFVPQMYDASPGTMRMSELARRRGNDQAALILRQGDISANLGQQLAGIAGQAAGAIGQYQAEAPQRKAAQADAERLKAMDQALRESIDPQTGRIDFQSAAQRITPIDPMAALQLWDKADSAQKQAVIQASELAGEAAQKAGSLLLRYQQMSPPEAQAEYDQLRAYAVEKRIPGADQMPEQFNAPFLRKTVFSVMTADQIRQQIMGSEKPKDDYSLGNKRFSGATNEVIAEAPPPDQFRNPVSVTGPDGKAVFVDPKDAIGKQPYTPPREPKDEPFRNPVAVIGPDGKPVFVDPRAAVGQQPASTREQGRSVTSGDAGRIAEFDTSLDDLGTLKATLFPDADLTQATPTSKAVTGAGAKIGAMLPNVVTEMTGWGSDAKSRQGVIDRVKQVIGKALEGGVLRKEDEVKYEKILPTIGDPPAVAKSKLEGLEKAIVQRRQRFVDSLESANFDTSRYNSAPAAKKNPFRK